VLDVKQVSAVPYSTVIPVTSHQYHVQDDLGQYSYGYSGGPSAKVETKTLDGVTRGKYSYVDGNGIVQSASYVADDVNGFRVAATNIPVGPSSLVLQEVLASPVVVENQVVAAKSPLAPVKYGY
jgi:Insect cuticle protein.